MNILSIDNLPKILPLIPLYGAILMPRSTLPLPPLDDEYAAIIEQIPLKHRYIGVVQPILSNIPSDLDASQYLFKTGCAGRIVDVIESDNGKQTIVLTGECRFDLIKEIDNDCPYRTAHVNYTPYSMDIIEEIDFKLDRPRLFQALKPYFKMLDMSPNWDEIQQISNEKLITALTMACPFQPNEKQAILEIPTLQEQSRLLQALLDHAVVETFYNHSYSSSLQ
ncbi:MAG: LON peptidase substrate-binding domain-containing protein [Candidatus Paracaedibacteraceae bacterium]|nr:LON peptidase substrate-binding domain-containing protein [Candidatus Paracaedibacteraceae bacterium]